MNNASWYRLMEVHKDLSEAARRPTKPTECHQFNPYEPNGISAPMMPMGNCVNCGKDEDAHDE